ncbi:hypothetical protein KQL98_005528, partial [Escherichia coli]|nr:hypothetical protein [Escherichia coli]EHQ0036129.1 hypothetical protein [Escherichia coli]
KAGEDAEQAAAGADADKNGVITDAEADAVTAANAKVSEAKQKAQEELDKVPEGTAGKPELVARLEAVDTAEVPEVTDADADGKADVLTAAEAAVAAA